MSLEVQRPSRLYAAASGLLAAGAALATGELISGLSRRVRERAPFGSTCSGSPEVPSMTNTAAYPAAFTLVLVANLTPATAAITVTTGAARQTYNSFTLTNAAGSPAATVDLTFTACSGATASCQFSNGTATISTNLAVNGTYSVPVSYVAATAGAGTVTVRAANGATTLSTATLTVTAQAGGNSMIIATQNLTTDSLLYRDECVSLSLGSAIASECGDLRVVHALPAVRTMGVTRAPVMMYSSALARGITVVPANLTLPASLTLTGPVTATLKVGGVTFATGSWPASGWSSM